MHECTPFDCKECAESKRNVGSHSVQADRASGSAYFSAIQLLNLTEASAEHCSPGRCVRSTAWVSYSGTVQHAAAQLWPHGVLLCCVHTIYGGLDMTINTAEQVTFCKVYILLICQ